jgi:hypothetical protein
LDEASSVAQDDARVRWQKGYVLHDGDWAKPEQVAKELERDLRLVEYRNIRGDYADTAPAQLELSQWCARKGLHDQKRAHLTRVLEIDPSHIVARRELGHRWVEGVWISAEEQFDAARRALQAEESFKTWPAKLVKLRDALDRRNQRQRDIAMERLLEIKDPQAIPAMEAVFGDYNEPMALALVEVLAGIPGADAATALARQAVFSPSETVRTEAAKKLHARPYEEFVPVLLSGMFTPVKTRAELYQQPSGRLIHQHAFYREGMDRAQLQLNETGFEYMIVPGRRARWQGGVSFQEQVRAQLALKKRAARAEQQVQVQNAETAALNGAICQALQLATNESMPSEPDLWWRWWASRNEVEYYEQKTVEFAYANDLLQAIRPRYPWERTMSCLVAGTPVWTETGMVPVEQMQIGDRVLAQDPHSGELTYKPVLRTTHRDPVETLCIDAGAAGSLTCSGGHLFWISGKGWTRARVMEPGMLVHTLDGAHEVKSVQVLPPADVYNLVVADFHSYFVADGRWLTHDNTPQSPTTATVPGLVSAQ